MFSDTTVTFGQVMHYKKKCCHKEVFFFNKMADNQVNNLLKSCKKNCIFP